MKRFNLRILSLVLVCIAAISCEKEKNNRTTIHENLFPRKVLWINVNTVGLEDTIGIIDYFKQSDLFDFDSIGVKMFSLTYTIPYNIFKLQRNGNTYNYVADTSSVDLIFGSKYLGEITRPNSNTTNLGTNYNNCYDISTFMYETSFEFTFDSLDRIKSYTCIPLATRCAPSGIISGTIANYTYSNNEDSCFISYEGDCTEVDTIVYYNDLHRSNIPYLGYTYFTIPFCTVRFSFGFDVFTYSAHKYKLIKQIRNGTNNYVFDYTYQFNSNNDVEEVIVRNGTAIAMKYKFYY